MDKRAIAIGDVFCIEIESSRIEAQYLGDHALMGECILLTTENDLERIRFERAFPQCIVFYPVRLNVRKGNASFLRHESPRVSIPASIRRHGVMAAPSQPLFWLIDDGEKTHRVSNLSTTQQLLPIGMVTSHLRLKERLLNSIA